MDILSDEAVQLFSFLPPFSGGVHYLRKELAPLVANSFFKDWIPFGRHASSNEANRARLLKLTTSLVEGSLKFKMLLSQICQYFLMKKFEKLLQCKSFSHFFNKNISVFGYTCNIIKCVTS